MTSLSIAWVKWCYIYEMGTCMNRSVSLNLPQWFDGLVMISYPSSSQLLWSGCFSSVSCRLWWFAGVAWRYIDILVCNNAAKVYLLDFLCGAVSLLWLRPMHDLYLGFLAFIPVPNLGKWNWQTAWYCVVFFLKEKKAVCPPKCNACAVCDII